MSLDLASQERIDIVCRVRSRQLRAWKRYSLRRDVISAGCIRPEAYSSCSTVFRGFLRWWLAQHAGGAHPRAVLWVVESPSNPRVGHRSLVARIAVREFYLGGCDVPENLHRYVRSWTGNRNFKEADCSVAEGDPDESRFFPANDIGRQVSRLRFVNRDGSRLRNPAGVVLRVHPGDVGALEAAAGAVARRTVFVSYKHVDFESSGRACRPTWRPEELAGLLIERAMGVWLDSLCAPARRRAGGRGARRSTWTDDEVRLLLAEGYAQSQVVLAIDTDHYATPGVKGTNWTLLEYKGSAGFGQRRAGLRRFILHAPGRSRVERTRRLRPVADETMPWPEELGDPLAARLIQLFGETGGRPPSGASSPGSGRAASATFLPAGRQR